MIIFLQKCHGLVIGMIYRQTQPASFQLTAARRRLAAARVTTAPPAAFQLTAARRRLESKYIPYSIHISFQLTAARRRLGHPNYIA